MLMAVYGTLRKGHGNYNYFLKEKKCLGQSTLDGFKMYSLGGYPCIVASDDKKDNIIIEVFELDDEKDVDTINGITAMEIGAGYQTKEVETEYGNAMIYVFTEAPKAPLLEHGDWNKVSNHHK